MTRPTNGQGARRLILGAARVCFPRFIDVPVVDDRLASIAVPGEQTSISRWRPWVQNTLGLAILIATGWVLWQRRSSFAELLDTSWVDLCAMGALVLVGWVLSAAQSWVLFRAEGAAIGFGENLLLACGGNFANYLPMRVGTLLRGRYMKQVHGLRYARFGSVFGIRTVLMLSAAGLLGTVGTLGLWLFEGRPAWLLLLTFVAMMGITVGALFLRLPRAAKTDKRLPRAWNDFLDGFATARARPGVSALVLTMIVLSQVVLGLRLFISFDAFQVDASIWLLVLLAPVVVLVSYTAITPGALGLREAVIGYVTLATGYDFSVGLFAGSLDRAVILALTLALGAPGFIYIWRRLGSEPSSGAPRPRALDEA